MLNARQLTLARRYVKDYPQLAELFERAANAGSSDGDIKTLGDAISKLPYPSWVDGTDAIEIGRIGMEGE